MELLYEKLKEMIPDRVYQDEPMKKHTSFKIGGNADIFAVIKNETELKEVLKLAGEVPVQIIGNGTNLLVTDKGIRGITLKIDIDHIELQDREENQVSVRVGSGVALSKLSAKLAKEGIARIRICLSAFQAQLAEQ